MDTPEVIPITDFRRDTARIIAAHIAAETPVFITQGGYVTAVVLSPERYRGLIRLAERGMSTDGRAARAASMTAAAGRHEAGCDFGDPTIAEILANGGFEFE